MGTIKYHPKGETPEQIQGLTEIIPAIDPRIALIIGHGIGERNAGDLAGCEESSGWPGWGNIKVGADKYGVLQVYINTTHDYEYQEYQFAVDWVLKHYPQLKDNIWVLGHSLGSFGFGKYGATGETLMPKLAGWIDSASGNFGDIPEVYKNIIDAKVRWWGVTSENDTASGTNPIAVTRVYDKVKALKADAPVILTEFPATEWPTPAGGTGSKTAHNAVLGRITQPSMYYSKGNIGLITKGIPTQTVKMNLYEWMLSNPRGSVYQPPTGDYKGPVYEAAQPAATTAKTIMRINLTGSGKPGMVNVVIQYSDGSSDPYFVATEVDTVQVNGKTRYTIKNKTTVLKQFEI